MLLGLFGDVTINTSAQQYGGFTIANIDSLIVPYAKKSYQFYRNEYLNNIISITDMTEEEALKKFEDKIEKYAVERVRKDMLAGCEELEYKFNTVASSRGDFSFISVSFGLDTTRWGRMMSECLMITREKGQGDPPIQMLFPKLIFMCSMKYLHGEGKPNHDLFVRACECSNRVMYPDFVSLDYTEENKNYVGRIYEKYGKAISPMGKGNLQPI